jgi:hypothetical protein
VTEQKTAEQEQNPDPKIGQRVDGLHSVVSTKFPFGYTQSPPFFAQQNAVQPASFLWL